MDPCLTAEISAPVWSPSSITVDHGATATAAFLVPSDTVDTATGLSGYCGTRNYVITDNSDASILWASVDTTTVSGSVTLTIDPASTLLL